MNVGYARISTLEQNLNLQHDALKQAGCGIIFDDKASGAKIERTGLQQALAYLRNGQDTLVVWKLDRLGRSIRQLIDLINQLQTRHIGFKSLQEAIDTTTSGGKLVFHLFSALAEFERDIIRERTHAGLQAARARGRQGGRPAALSASQILMAQKLHEDKNNSIADICKTLDIKRATFYKYLKQAKASKEAV